MDTQQRFARLLASIVETVQTRGWHAIYVGGATTTSWAYTQGLKRLGHPDIIVFGLPPKVAHAFMQMIYDSLRNGNVYVPAVSYDDLADGYMTQFVDVTAANVERYCGITSQVYALMAMSGLLLDAAAPFRQMLFPDRQGRWPWEDGCDPLVAQMPLLGPRLDR